jgi:hypothetical protein
MQKGAPDQREYGLSRVGSGWNGSTFLVSERSGFYPRLVVDSAARTTVSHAGGVLLCETARAVGLDRLLSAALAPWRKPLAIHDPAKIVCDLAVMLSLGGDCLADLALLREQPGVFGPIASDPTVSRLIETLAKDADRVLAALADVTAKARQAAWTLAGEHAPNLGMEAVSPLVVDLDATLITAHSDKEGAAPTYKRGYGHHPLWAFADHGETGTGEPLAVLLRPGNAGSNTAVDHIALTRAALAQLPGLPADGRPGRKVLIRTDGAGGTHEFVNWLARRRLSYSVGFPLPADTEQLIAQIPKAAWAPAYDSDSGIRDGAFVAELTGVLDLSGWPDGLRVIVRKERPHPGAQLRFTDVDGNRITAFATNTSRGQLADLELRHRRRARCEDRIRNAKDTGLANLPLHSMAQNRIWCALVTLAADLLAWTQLLAFAGQPTRRWEPKKLRLRLLSIAGRIACTGRRVRLHLPERHPHTRLLLTGLNRIRALPAPG